MKRSDESERADSLGRREFCTAVALAGATFAALSQAAAQELSVAGPQIETSETKSHVVGESRNLSGDLTTAEIFVDSLICWGVSHAFGLVGDGTGPDAIHLMNGLYDAHYGGAPVLAITGRTFHDYGCDLGPIDFVGFAKACGADGFRCATPAEVRPSLISALRSPRAAIVEAVVDPDEAPAKPEDVRA